LVPWAFFSEGQWQQTVRMYHLAVKALVEIQDVFEPDALLALRHRILREPAFSGCAGMASLAEPSSVGRADLATALESCLTWLSSDARLHLDFYSNDDWRHGAEAGARRAALHARLLRQQTSRATSESSPRLVLDAESPAGFRIMHPSDARAAPSVETDDPAGNGLDPLLDPSLSLKQQAEDPEPCPSRYTGCEGDPWSAIIEWSPGGGEPSRIEVVQERFFGDRTQRFEGIKTILGHRPLPDAYAKLYRWQCARPILEQDWRGEDVHEKLSEDARWVLHELLAGSADGASLDALRQRVLLTMPSLVSWTDPVGLLRPRANTGWLLASALANCFTWLAQFESEDEAWPTLRSAADARFLAQLALAHAEQSKQTPNPGRQELGTTATESRSEHAVSEARC
jgi:hypothetical protein